MKHGIIIKNIADLRAKPDFRSERKSQLLYNDAIKIEKKRNSYYRVIQPDQYFGWVSQQAVRIISSGKLKDYQAGNKFRVKSKTAKVHQLKSHNITSPGFLFYGTEVSCLRTQGGNCIIKDIDDNSFSLSKNNLELAKKRKNPKPNDIIKEAMKFIGVPYLWGGISPFGFDCSGFVRTIMRMFNIELARDSCDQYKTGQTVPYENIKPADLLFFKGHVGIASGNEQFIHASLGEGGVAVNSLNLKAPDYRKDLFDTYLGARRVLP